MAIVNRTLDPSQQNTVVSIQIPAVATGLTVPIVPIASQGTLQALRVSAQGISGSPQYIANIYRFNSTGITIMPVSSTFVARDLGISGLLSVSLFASASLIQLLPNDYIGVNSFASNAAVTALTVSVVYQAVQDIKTSFGV